MKTILQTVLVGAVVLCCTPFATAQTTQQTQARVAVDPPDAQTRAAWHGTLQTEVQRLDSDLTAFERDATAMRDATARDQMTRRHADFHSRHQELQREATELQNVDANQFAQRHHDLTLRQARLDADIRTAQLEGARTRADFNRATTTTLEAYDRDMTTLRQRFSQADGLARARYARQLIHLRNQQDALRHRHTRMARIPEAQFQQERAALTRDLAQFRTTYAEGALEADRMAMRDKRASMR
ncbi:hypothetical protein BH23BAC4_BH23BAC4_11470 [soil metagenome]